MALESEKRIILHALMGYDNQYIISFLCNFNYRQMSFKKVIPALLLETKLCKHITNETGWVLAV